MSHRGDMLIDVRIIVDQLCVGECRLVQTESAQKRHAIYILSEFETCLWDAKRTFKMVTCHLQIIAGIQVLERKHAHRVAQTGVDLPSRRALSAG